LDAVSIAWGTALVLAVGVVVLLFRAAGEGRRTREKTEELEGLRKEVRSAKRQLEQQTKALRKSVAETERLTRQAGKAQKQAARGKGGAREERAKIAELEAELRAEAERASARAAEALAAREAELRAARARFERLEQELAGERERAHAAAAEASAPAAADDGLTALTERAERAEAALRERDAALAAAADDAERLSRKLATQETLYVSIRSELAIKKDHLRQQREELERLRAYKVAIVDAPDEASGEEAPAREEAGAEIEPAGSGGLDATTEPVPG